ncbi:MAG: hypothetical protein K6B44_11585 [Lachnospiraceae bacterium]|nr:hypothetical protein [Lachnospiraceae bacterium]
MAIGMVEMQGAIPRVQDFQQFQQNENDKVLIYHDNQAMNMDEKVDNDNNAVHEKEDAYKSNDSKERNKEYGESEKRKKKKKEKPEDRIIEKKKMSFDIKI